MKAYLDKIKAISKHLTYCAQWKESKSSISKIYNKTNSDKDYIYEFFCYLAILDNLSLSYDLEFIPGKGEKEFVFPKSPANKSDYPYFVIIDRSSKDVINQVCSGTFVVSIGTNKKRAPDISFQKPNADRNSPTYKEIDFAFDAKRKRDPSAKKLSKGQYSYFTNMISELDLRKPVTTYLTFTKFPSLHGNCLITNLEGNSKDSDLNIHHNIKEVEFFDFELDLTKINVIG